MSGRLDEIDERLRSVEQAVVELGVMARYMKYAVLILAASLGYDVSTVML
tara:strand:+ start:9570 stop:9719 length:150 start_codon:yes stop_codon:yes gene_type:complete